MSARRRKRTRLTREAELARCLGDCMRSFNRMWRNPDTEVHDRRRVISALAILVLPTEFSIDVKVRP